MGCFEFMAWRFVGTIMLILIFGLLDGILGTDIASIAAMFLVVILIASWRKT